MTLVLDDVHAAYGPAEVLRGVNLEVPEGTSMVLVGRNGMGKTSTMRCIMGLSEPAIRRGRILLGDQQVSGLRPHTIVEHGIGYVPQGRRIFGSLTVRENLLLAAKRRGNAADRWSLSEVFALYPRLEERSSQLGATLSGGEQQMLAVGRGLMSNPKVLLLDEPSEGLAPLILNELLGTLESLRDTGMTIFMAEQNFAVAQRMADRVAVVERGTIVLVDTPESIAGQTDVQRRYLGV